MNNTEGIKCCVNGLELKVFRNNTFNEKEKITNLIFGDIVSTDNLERESPVIKNKKKRIYKNITFKINGKKINGIIEPKKIPIDIYEKTNDNYTIKRIEEDNLIQKKMLEIYFIDVGQGDSTLIITPNEKIILIDGGPDNSCYKFLKKKFDKLELDAVIITHADNDHVKGLINIFNDENIIIKNIFHNGIAKFDANKKNKYTLGKPEKIEIEGTEKKILTSLYDDLSYFNESDKVSDEFKKLKEGIENAIKNASKQGYKTVLKRIDNKNGTDTFSNLLNNLHDSSFQPELSIDVLGPINIGSSTKPAYLYFKGDNNTGKKSINGNSIVLLIRYKDCRIFLGGDINEDFENHFLENNKNNNKSIQAHIFKANHHGSDDFNRNFLQNISPSISIVSSGSYQNFGHPRAILLGSLGKLNTNESSLLFCTQLIGKYEKVGILARLFHSKEKELEYEENDRDKTNTDKSVLKKTYKFIKELGKKIEDVAKELRKKFSDNSNIINNIYPVYIKPEINSIVVRSDGIRIFAGRIYKGNEEENNGKINKISWEKHLFTIKGNELKLITMQED